MLFFFQVIIFSFLEPIYRFENQTNGTTNKHLIRSYIFICGNIGFCLRLHRNIHIEYAPSVLALTYQSNPEKKVFSIFYAYTLHTIYSISINEICQYTIHRYSSVTVIMIGARLLIPHILATNSSCDLFLPFFCINFGASLVFLL